MKRRETWLEKLTQEEREHLVMAGIQSVSVLRRQVAFLKNQEFPCLYCLAIGKKVFDRG